MIVLKRNDGHVAIMTVVRPETDLVEDAIRKFKEQHPEFIEHYEYEGELPDRQFRDAWEFKNNKIVVNQDKAKTIHMERIRELRNKKLEELDKEQLKHLAFPGMTLEIEHKKQLLRDAPAKIMVDVSKSPIELLQGVL